MLDQALASSSASRPRDAAAEDERQQLVVAERRGPRRSSFSRGRSCGATSFIYTQSFMRLWCRAALACLLVVLATACASPPNKEMDQAQGAIDAARAAGADRYAADEFAAATTALKSATDAVAQGDYRLALNHALDSREQAQNAARVAADTRAKVRGEVERSIAEVQCAHRAGQRVDRKPGGRTRTPRTRRTAQQVVTASTADVQKAGSAMQAEDYAGAQKLMTATKERLQKVLPAAPNAAAAQSTRRRK